MLLGCEHGARPALRPPLPGPFLRSLVLPRRKCRHWRAPVYSTNTLSLSLLLSLFFSLSLSLQIGYESDTNRIRVTRCFFFISKEEKRKKKETATNFETSRSEGLQTTRLELGARSLACARRSARPRLLLKFLSFLSFLVPRCLRRRVGKGDVAAKVRERERERERGENLSYL